jgi:alkanesulfonate monooxygenase SsuD/methylene tetrahydromethanopterin reductase-like flavin-dependent oxidoreductase (luciferase family)
MFQASFTSPVFYFGTVATGWPTPVDGYLVEEAARSMGTALAQFKLADELGYDWVGLTEHHFGPFSLTPNPTVFAGAMTQVVKRAKIALLGSLVPMLNPVRVAEEVAMLDTMSNGRVVAGMLRGTPNENVTYNTNPSESRARFEEALLLIREAWTQPMPFGWQGRFFEFRAISIWPRPVQQPHPPIFMSGSSPESAAFAGRNHVSLGLAVTTLPLATEAAKRYRAAANEAGWTPTPDNVLYRLGFHVADSDEQAAADFEASHARRQRGSPVLANQALEATIAGTGYYGADQSSQRGRVRGHFELADRLELGQIMLGSPATVLAQAERIRRQLGAGIFDLIPAFELGDRTLHSLALFASKVLPQLRESDHV